MAFGREIEAARNAAARANPQKDAQKTAELNAANERTRLQKLETDKANEQARLQKLETDKANEQARLEKLKTDEATKAAHKAYDEADEAIKLAAKHAHLAAQNNHKINVEKVEGVYKSCKATNEYSKVVDDLTGSSTTLQDCLKICTDFNSATDTFNQNQGYAGDMAFAFADCS